VRFAVQVKPRSSRSGLVAVREGALAISVKAPPVDGAANAELLKVVAKWLGVRRAAVSIAIGATGRTKLIDVEGIDEATVRRCLSTSL